MEIKIPYIILFVIISQISFLILLSYIIRDHNLIHKQPQQHSQQHLRPDNTNLIHNVNEIKEVKQNKNFNIASTTLSTSTSSEIVSIDYYKQLLDLNGNNLKSCTFYPEDENSPIKCKIPNIEHLKNNIHHVNLAMMMCTRLVDIHKGDRQFIETALTGIKSYIIHRNFNTKLTFWVFVNPLEQYYKEFQKVFELWPTLYKPTIFEFIPSTDTESENLKLKTVLNTTNEYIRIVFIDIVANDYAILKKNKLLTSLYSQIFTTTNLDIWTNKVFRRCSVLKLFIPLLVSFTL